MILCDSEVEFVACQNATIRLAGVGGQEVLLLLAGLLDRCSNTWS
jgi:hypothetical protein